MKKIMTITMMEQLKVKNVTYVIIDNKTQKEVGVASLSSNNEMGHGALFGQFLGKNFRINNIHKDPQAAFNSFTKWPSTKKRFGNLLKEHGDQELDGKDRNPFSRPGTKQNLEDIVKEQSILLHSRYGLVKAIEVVKRHIQKAKTLEGKKLYQDILKELEDVKAYQDKYKKEYDSGNTGDFYDPKMNIHKMKE